MIPEITMTVPVPYEREYASSPISVSPSHEYGITKEEIEVSLEYAAFLIDEGELSKEEYIDRLLEETLPEGSLGAEFEAYASITNEETAFNFYRKRFTRQVDKAVRENRTSWESWL